LKNFRIKVRATAVLAATAILLATSARLHAQEASPSENATPSPLASPQYIFNPTSCHDLGPAFLDLFTNTNSAVLSAVKAGFRADSLKTGADYKAVEDDAVSTRVSVLKAYTALGAVLTTRIANPDVMSATMIFANEAQGQLQVAQQFALLALDYERTVNAQNKRRHALLYAAPFLLVAPVLAGGFMAGAAGAHTTTSTTTGNIDGQQFTATTTTRDYSEANAINLATSQNQAQRKEALELYTPQVSTLPYVLGPLSQDWIDTCKRTGS